MISEDWPLYEASSFKGKSAFPLHKILCASSFIFIYNIYNISFLTIKVH